MKIKIIDWVFDVNVDDEKVINFFHNYLSQENIDYKITIDNNDIEYEKNNLISNDYDCLLLAIYRKIIDILASHDVFLFHGSALVCDGVGIIFSGHSGAGKSTHASLYREYKNATMINDDKPLIVYKDNKFYVYGTPYMGKHKLGDNICHELNKICFIRQSKSNSINKINGKEKLELLINQVLLSDDINKKLKVIELVNKLSLSVDTYILDCDISKDAFESSYKTLCQK